MEKIRSRNSASAGAGRSAASAPKARRGNPEYQEQKALFRWSQQPQIRGKYPCLKLLFHIKNEERSGDARSVAVDRANGVKKGVPDLCLPVPRGGYHGLYIEMKAPNGRTSPEQDWWLEELRGQGYRASVCYCWEDAAAVILNYLEGTS